MNTRFHLAFPVKDLELTKILSCYSLGVSKGKWKDYALEIGYGVCESGPLIRSSYHAEEQSDKFDVLNRRKTLMATL